MGGREGKESEKEKRGKGKACESEGERERRREGERGLLQQNSPIKLAKFFQIIVSF